MADETIDQGGSKNYSGVSEMAYKTGVFFIISIKIDQLLICDVENGIFIKSTNTSLACDCNSQCKVKQVYTIIVCLTVNEWQESQLSRIFLKTLGIFFYMQTTLVLISILLGVYISLHTVSSKMHIVENRSRK